MTGEVCLWSLFGLIGFSAVTAAFYSTGCHVIGFSDLIHLWGFKINVVRQDQVNRAQNADHAPRTCERLAYCRVKITRILNKILLLYRSPTGCWIGSYSYEGSYRILQDPTWSCRILQDPTWSYRILHDPTRSCRILSRISTMDVKGL